MLCSGTTKHPEGAAGVGATWEDYREGGGGAGRLCKVLSSGNTGGAFFWGGDVGVVGANGAEIRRSACGFTETGEKVKGK